ncbi:MAG: rhodanese-like domain-containing protein [Verrucomicrobiota bacterium]|jgi:rhodanese-related sulfurtransferase
MKTIAPLELQKLLQTDPDLLLLDVRTPVEYAEVHVSRARNEPLQQLQPEKLVASGILPNGRPVYLLCRSGGRAAKAAEKFAAAGIDRAVVIEGGTQAWIEAGLPVARGTSSVMSLERQVRIVAGSLVLLGVLLGWLVHPAFYGLSAFVGAGLVFAGITDFCGMGLLLARMPWNNRVCA